MKQTWIYFQNPFLNVTKKNFKKAVKLSTYTDAQLLAKSTDPFYGPIYTAYHPIHLALVAAYNAWKAQGGTQSGATETLGQLLKLLSPFKLNNWDRLIQAAFAKGSAIYLSIFPQGHKIFQRGTALARINAVAQLVLALTGKAGVTAVLTDVTNFNAQLVAANAAQTGNMGTTATLSNAVEATRVTAMGMLYNILGQCMVQFSDDPTVSGFIFDLDTVRTKQQTYFTSNLRPSAHKMIAQRTWLLTDTIDADNDGATDLGYYMAARKGDGPEGYTLVTVLAGNDDTITIDEFTNDTDNRFLSVVNLSTLVAGHYAVDLS